jgi:predicted DNA-binding protein
VRQGERVKDYPQTSLRLPPEIKTKLYALSLVSATPQWRVVSAALECFFRERSEAEQRQVLGYMVKQPSSLRRRRSPRRGR